jgi:hypothetical protein
VAKPVAYATYPGTNGRTQGEINESRPAKSAIGSAAIKVPLAS